MEDFYDLDKKSEGVRDLNVSQNGKSREINLLRVTNIDHFFKSYGSNNDSYLTRFQILHELENKIKYENDPSQVILIPYKLGGDIIFQLVSIEMDEYNRRVVKYEYDTSIS